MQRAIPIRFGLADVILEPTRHRAPPLVDHSQGAVAVLLRRANNPKAVDVGQSRKTKLLFLHLAPDGKRTFSAASHVSRDLSFFQFINNVEGDACDHVTAGFLQRHKAAHNRGARLRLKHGERQILQLLPHPLHPHAPSKRRIDIHCLMGLLRLLVRGHVTDRAHVVQTVSQLDQDNPQVLGHRHEKLAKILGLFGLRAAQLKIGQLGNTIDQHRNFRRKHLSDFGERGARVLDRIMQQGCDDRGVV